MSAEAQFRLVEVMLDEQVSALLPNLREVTIRDLSARNYHYKNQFLSWSYQFVRDTKIDAEVERISVFLTYIEPFEGEGGLSCLVRAEVFQQAQVSRVDRKRRYVVSIEQVRSHGLESLLKDAFAQGAALLLDA